ncbi:23S rRNA (cytosine1962-C5)-methyltransferase [Limimonas halophila]|uniref:23S rRNA (Cytosine1962-C5)-methyltransferase n=1 Tax=Limimonas halophila TaxID=1082479 RepID=A0A1G7SIB5_9PROT|nr:RsmD family RNA methyltransferase [Limimonas halophila]SDG22748.1 23S rRNA (cytosine1962-C5)-methyltransferase [Limimonas halophila]
MTPDPTLLVADGWRDYELLDSGGGRKLERYGVVTVIRPEPQAIWRPALDDSAWRAADAWFEGGEDSTVRWQYARPDVPATWPMTYAGVAFDAGFTAFRHLGVFPEQAVHWDWLAARIAGAGRPVSVLNLFAYTGVASLVAARAGAHVTHLDASKKAITWANANQHRAGLEDAPIRWICDDARKFLKREVRRGRQYDVILLDPPKYGRGTKGEVWRLYDDLGELLGLCRDALTPDALGLVATVYAIRLSSVSLHTALAAALDGLPGAITSGEMGARDGAGRVLSSAVYARWDSAG